MERDERRRAWQIRCSTMGEKLVLLACVEWANKLGKVRWEPEVLAARTGMNTARVEAALLALDRAGHIRARHWEDSGAWSIELTMGGQS